MNIYLIPIKYALITFPFLAILFTLPYILKQYYKYGAIHKLRTIIIYSFILYLLTSYFLVILPLPSKESVLNLNIAHYQIIPFNSLKLLYNSLNSTQFTILKLIKNPIFYTTVYNIILTIPFGIYLRYYFKCHLSKTIFLSFLLSLFFEITQLTGLYFIYPRNYRMFDVDDLFFNTLGGFIGYLIAPLFMYFLPSREKIDNETYRLGETISFLRRLTSFLIDLFYFVIIIAFLFLINKLNIYIFIIIAIIYYLIYPLIFKGTTLGKKIVSLKVTTCKNEKYLHLKLFFRNLILYFLIIPLPYYLYLINHYFTLKASLILTLFILNFLLYFYMLFKLIIKERLFYEVITDTTNQSTIKVAEK